MTQFSNPFSEEVWSTTYKHHSDKNVDGTIRRVAKAVASVEKTDKLQQEWEDAFYEMLSDFKVTAGGRIYANAGTEFKGTTLINCYVGPRDDFDIDSLDGIVKVLREQAQTLKSEGGWGMNFSFIRPRGSYIYGIGVDTPGAVKYMEAFDKISEIVTAGSGKKKSNAKAKDKIRKGAMMGILDIWHPDVEEFITAKQTQGKLTKFNMSVNCSAEFMDKIVQIRDLKKNGQEIPPELDKWDLVFPETTFDLYKAKWDGNITEWKKQGYPLRVYRTVSASELWEKITQSTYNRNEPGVLFLDNANRTHAWNYGGRQAFIAATNPCGEQSLPFGGCCNLLSLNLVMFFDFKKGTIDFEKLSHYTKVAIRFADNVNDYSNAPLPQYEESLRKRRRIGLGVLGWASLLYLSGIRFASDEAEKLKDQIMKCITHTAVETSINLAIEKGSFIGCDPEKHAEAEIWKMINLPDELLKKIKRYGIRNSALFSIQPTGNTSCFANITSSGIEPIFAFEYIRTVIVNVVPDHIKDVCPKYWEGEMAETDMFKWSSEGDEQILVGKDKDGVVYKIDKNRGLTKEVLCRDVAYDYLKEHDKWNPKADWAVTAMSLTVEDHIRDMIGWYKWIDSSISKTVNLPNDYPYDKFKDIYLDLYASGTAKGMTTYRAGTMANVLAEKKDEDQKIDNDGRPTKITKTASPKRPTDLPCDVHFAVVKGKPYYVVVGMLGDDPYEVFTGNNEDKRHGIAIPRKIEGGIVSKKSRGQYLLTNKEHEFETLLTNGHSDENADALTRIISASLRHGTDISYIVHQLEKTEGDLISFAKALARTLKKYIPDGTSVAGEKCPDCHGKLIRSEGCIKCTNCTFSKCG